MLAEMTSEHLGEWMAYSKLEPWGEERADLRAGIVASVIANSNKAKNKKPFKPTDFMPAFEPVGEDDMAERLLAKALRAFGGRG